MGSLSDCLSRFFLGRLFYRVQGSIGFCMGGGLSLALAARLAETQHPLHAAVTCYGTPPRDHFDVRNITKVTPVQGHFGGKDEMKGFSDPEAGKPRSVTDHFDMHVPTVFLADALEFSLNISKLQPAQVYRYPEQGHAFLNDDDWSIEKRKELGFVDKTSEPKEQEKAVRDLAWSRISEFFVTHLGGRTSRAGQEYTTEANV